MSSTPPPSSTLGILGLAAAMPLAIAHPLTFAVFVVLFLHEPFTRHVETNVDALTWPGRFVWVGLALLTYAALTAVGLGLFRLRGLPFARAARLRALSQLGYLLLVPLAYLVVMEPFEGNIVGFFYFPYYLLGTAVAVSWSFAIHVWGFVSKPRPPA